MSISPLKRILMVVVASVAVLGNTTLAQQNCNTEEWQRSAGYSLTDFLDALMLASATSRGALAPVVIEMNHTYRAFERASHPRCMWEAVSETIQGMSDTIVGYELFMGSSDNAQKWIADGHDSLKQASELFHDIEVPVDYRMVVFADS